MGKNPPKYIYINGVKMELVSDGLGTQVYVVAGTRDPNAMSCIVYPDGLVHVDGHSKWLEEKKRR